MRRLTADPPEWLVHDGLSACVYLPGETARLPLRMPARMLNARDLAARLAAGDRRQGVLLYRPSCPTCRACEPIRIDVDRFVPDRTQRRVWRRGEALIETRVQRPEVTAEKVRLYNRHKAERGLLVGTDLLDAPEYEQFLVETCANTLELVYRVNGALVGVAVADRAADALSAVYCFFDPDRSGLSPGTYSILKQIELCRAWGLRYLYLGLYVGACRALAYKARYVPHERLVAGEWCRFEGHPPLPSHT
ncbi:arginyltransferase [Candidatus Binatia bacterium]|nr:arginyltransferase [Candidatus Binatia bacterium]